VASLLLFCAVDERSICSIIDYTVILVAICRVSWAKHHNALYIHRGL